MLRRRYKEAASLLIPNIQIRPFAALREKFKEGYTFSDFKCDLMSGLVVSMVAVPLSMALAIASGVSPQNGLYTAIIAGSLVALFGGSRFQVTGPTAAFVVILAPIAHKFGLGGLLMAGLMSGVALIIMGAARMGRLIQFIPYPVTTGFTAGIAVVIATLQLKDFFGLHVGAMPERFTEKVVALFQARGSASWVEFSLGVLTLFLLLVWPKVTKRVPAPLIALTTVSAFAAFLKFKYPHLEIATIGNRFTYELNGVVGHGVPQTLPAPNFPWKFIGADGKAFEFTLSNLEALVPSAFAVTLLGAIESLLSAVVADGMAQTKHDPDAELVALGFGNLVCPFFGGIAATGAIARTATNIRFGARSPFSSILHGLFTLIVVVSLAPLVSYLPMAALAALLMLVAYNMSEVKHFFHILKVAPGSDVVVLLLCFFLTVIFDMVVGVSVGVGLASLLFMRRMATLTSSQLFTEGHHAKHEQTLPKNVVLYEIAGPMFFGAAETAVGAMAAIGSGIDAVIFDLEEVPVMDVTGLVAFEAALNKLTKLNREIFIVGLREQPARLIRDAGLVNEAGKVRVCQSLQEAVDLYNSLSRVGS